MECQIYRLLIDEMDFDSLIDDLKPYVLKHMNTCEQCAAYYKDINKVDAMISEFANVGTPAAELDIAMPPRESNSVAVFFRHIGTYLKPIYLQWAGAAAFGMLAVIGVQSRWFSHSMGDQVLTARLGQPTVVRLEVDSPIDAEGATLVLATDEGVHFVTKAAPQSQVLKLKLQLKKGKNMIPVVVQSSEVGQRPLLVSILHPRFQRSATFNVTYGAQL